MRDSASDCKMAKLSSYHQIIVIITIKCGIKDKLTIYSTETQIYTTEYIGKCTASKTVVNTVV